MFGLELEGVARQKRRWRQAVQSGGGWNEHQVGPFGFVALVNTPKCGQAFANQVLVGRKGVVGQRFPVGKNGAAQGGCKEGHFVYEPLRICGVGGDHRREAPLGFFAFGQLGQ